MRSLAFVCVLLLAACTGPEPAADRGSPPALDIAQPDAAADLGSDGAVDLPRDRGDDRSPDQASDQAPCTLLGVYSSSDPGCNQCAEARCCAELNACFAEPQCDDLYVNCTLACVLTRAPDAGPKACLQQCAIDYPQGRDLYVTAMGCAEARCAAECS